ncbi:MAG TPA: sialidase family protein, partial [Candidatus Thermoplasmatota archaeon]|nr:sialidase family protein [Candidatus Thermoplasmatota archaeon]
PFSSGGAWLSQAALALDPDSGALFVAWADRSVPSPTAVVMRSTDEAQTWEQVHVAGAPGFAYLLPTMVARGGQVVLLSLREHSSGLFDAAVDVSGDGGATWADPDALNSAPLCTCFLQLRTPQRSGGMFGHYVGLDAQAGAIAAAWMDDRDAVKPQGVYARVGTLG